MPKTGNIKFVTKSSSIKYYDHWKKNIYIPATLWDKITDFTDEPLIQCNLPAIKNTSLDDGDNGDHK